MKPIQTPNLDPEFGLMLDIGRKRFEVSALCDFVTMMKRQGMSLLHLHFSENNRFGIESEIVKPIADQPQPLSKQEVYEVVDFAQQLGIAVMGEIGMPGHMGAILQTFPELQLRGDDGSVFPFALDVSHPAALSVCKELIDEFLPLFPGIYWHIGADEYLSSKASEQCLRLAAWAGEVSGVQSNVRDAKLVFLNELVDYLQIKNRHVRAWGDELLGGLSTKLNNDVIVEWWSETSPVDLNLKLPQASDYLEAGHCVINCSWTPLYYVLAANASLPHGFTCQPEPQALAGWNLLRFQGSVSEQPEMLAEAAKVKGAKFHVWCDAPDLPVIAEQIEPMIKMLRTGLQSGVC